MAKVSALLTVCVLGGTACAVYEEPPPQYQEPARTSTAVPLPAPTRAYGPATEAPVTAAPVAAAPLGTAYRPGYGVVESITLVRPAPSAAAGGSVAAAGHPTYQLNVRMDDGSVQSVLRDNRSILVGDRVHLTNDGRVLRL
jgi:hypothetical protein